MHTHDTLKRRAEETNKGHALRPTIVDLILPFREECPANSKKLDSTDKNLNAHELFNKFTADIIKTNVVFTR